MSSKLEICNNALIKVGAERVDSLTDNNKRARVVNFQYPIVRRRMLRAHPWNFAIKRAILTPSAEKPVFGFTYQFTLPADCLRLYQIDNLFGPYKLEGRNILTNYFSSEPYGDTLNIKYIFDIEDVSKFDSSFYDLLSLALAAEISFPLIQDKNLTAMLNRQLDLEVKNVRSFSSQEDTPDPITPDTFVSARQGDYFDPNYAG